MNAISILHKNRKIHSNIKPFNLMINNNIGKLVGLDDLVDIVHKETYYFYTAGSIDYLAPERFKYFKDTGFFGMTSIYSDIWELLFSILCLIDVIDVDEFFYLLYNNDNLLEYYLLNRFVKIFRLEYTNTIMTLVSKYVNLCVIGLDINPLKRKKTNYYLEKLIGYRNIVC
jgi:serine/threonine protein kinase